MTFFRITKPHLYLESIKIWYADAFPIDERREPDDLQNLLQQTDMHLCALLSADELVGFIIYWQWDDIVFVEHLAMAPNQRGKQYGQQAMLALIRLNFRYCLLEVERPDDELRQRRVRFYERQGFYLNPYDYRQPPYQLGMSEVPMRLLSIPAIESEATYQQLSKLIREKVYERFYV
ncbi:GNAT family N-acetyltransferase [Spirosoma sp. BT702]|uniref:GNAT family N-acetyltransferase n=1 Tax=Spirosoma profusum TaxID=2771354 RepID=A0A927ASP7_9BACT|nr:GNAT family N-acetyltransferase [Spirosoma profusum]MBD2704203.1 GNAT family N-acetyltransferase [Spirosoma profusum]